jgi:threonine dehydratase
MDVIHSTEVPTPLIHSRSLSHRYRREVFLKLESLSPVRSFKHRGALAAVPRLVANHGTAGLYTASTGNHGQGVAYAGARADVAVTVCAPTNTLIDKVEAMRNLGASVTMAGSNLSEAQDAAKEMADANGGIYMEDGEDPELMAGAASVVGEILVSQPEIGNIIIPVGGGNLIAGSLLIGQMVDPSVNMIGVQSVAAPAATISWLAGRVLEHPCATTAGGLATERPGFLAHKVMDRFLRTMVLVDEADLAHAIALGFRETGCIMEGAAAASLAALDAHFDDLGNGSIALVVTGSWLAADELASALQTTGPEARRDEHS